MAPAECPRFRSGLVAVPDQSDPHYVFVVDQLRISSRPQRLSLLEFGWLQMFNGRRTLRDIQAEAMRQVNGQLLPLELFARLAAKLDEALLLDGPRLRSLRSAPVREPSCIGCYAADPNILRTQLEHFFTCPEGPGLPRALQPDRRLCAALMPHIDYHRGGMSFAWGFKEVFEQTDAALFVIVGTSHYSSERFTLTRKDFKTPLGVARTDQDYIDRLVAHYGPGLFEDELAHLPEHSIELEVVFLQYLYEKHRAIRIVPLVVGSFQDAINGGRPPRDCEDIGRMIEALRRAEKETAESICYIISGDLAHLGPKFGDNEPVAAPLLRNSRDQDQAILRKAEAANVDGYFQVIADEGDRRRICGLPPTYIVLDAFRPSRGKVLHYDQYVHPRGYESVSFASVAFYP
ncbi:MAG TPA: AmmeMemoRadiSam system protein B [Gemmataceae bacterium]|nr:AmmeMemoRadiSam system protein B [Gemmataceae bacterium]